MPDGVEFYELLDEGDERGHAWQLLGRGVDFLDALHDIHVMTLERGCVRGNHFHRNKHEILVIQHTGEWALHWDNGPNEPAQEQAFGGPVAVAVLVPPGCAHAVVNHAGSAMQVTSFSDRAYDRAAPDSHRRILVELN